MDVLLTWIGARDPGWDNPRTGQFELGPVLSLLHARRFDVVYVLFNLSSRTDDFRQRANAVLRYCQQRLPAIDVRHRPVDVISVTDHREIYRLVSLASESIIAEEGLDDRDYYVYLSPGTPQMQTVWVLLVQSGLLPARMIEAAPPDLLASGAPSWREVDLLLLDFPQVVTPGEMARLVGLLEAQNENLLAENRLLYAENELLRTQGVTVDALPLGRGFELRSFLRDQERSLFALALERSHGNAAQAARLLGVDPAAFRARAATLGVRLRRSRGSQES